MRSRFQEQGDCVRLILRDWARLPPARRSSLWHNTLLIDGDAESQVIPGNAVFGTSPSVTHSLTGDQASLVQADLTSAYAAKLTNYTRTLFFEANGPLIVIDQVKADTAHTYTQVWHPKQRIDTVDAEQSRFSLSDGKHGIAVQAFARSGLDTVQRESPLPLTSYEKAERKAIERPARFEISTAKPETMATIVTLIQADHRSKATWKDEAGVEILALDDAGVELEGPRIVAWWAHGALALNTTHYRDRRTPRTLHFSKPVDMQILRSANGTASLDVDATEATELSLEGFSLKDQAANPIHLNAGHTSLLLR